jgi:hypothetical protein
MRHESSRAVSATTNLGLNTDVIPVEEWTGFLN